MPSIRSRIDDMELPLLSRAQSNATAWVGDDTLGPQAYGQFDFTLLFEHVFLAILPACLLLLVSPLYMLRFFRKPTSFRQGWLLWAKIATGVLLLAVEISNAALIVGDVSGSQSTTAIAAAVLSSTSTLSLIAIVYAVHRRSFQSSGFLSAFLSITLLLNVARARSHILRRDYVALSVFQVAIAALKFFLVVLEEIPKRGSLLQGPEIIAGFWNRSLFVWLNKTLLIGFKNIISLESLSPLDFRTEDLAESFQKRWPPDQRARRHCLVLAVAKTVSWSLIAIIVPRLCYAALFFAQPFLLHTIVRTVGQQGGIHDDVANGLIAATALVYFGLALTKTYYTHMMYRCITMVRGILVSAIFNHTLRLDHETAKKSAAVTLMSTDVDNIEAGFVMMHDLWAGILELGIGLYLLARYVGAAAVLTVIPTVLSTLSTRQISKRTGPAVKAWNRAVQDRVASSNHILRQIKQIKMTGLSSVAACQLQDLRNREIEKSKNRRKLIILTFGLSQFFSTSTPVIVIAGGLFWTKSSNSLDAADTFATLALTALITGPMSRLLIGFPQVAGLLACFSRIQDFLLLESLPERRQLLSGSIARIGHDDFEMRSNSNNAKSGIELEAREPAVGDHLRSSMYPAIVFSDVTICPAVGAEPILKEASLTIRPSTVTMILGPTGSGKSTLLKAIIGESVVVKGIVSVDSPRIGYCDQSCWLRNVSIQRNITASLDFDPVWYKQVLSSCMLDEDLLQISGGDQSLIGSGGALLSGGQKQRVALARAVYARCPMLVLDDVFSALDRKTTWSILCRLMGPSGILRAQCTTVVMVTHYIDSLKFADKVVTLDGEGSFAEREHTPFGAHDQSLREDREKTSSDKATDSEIIPQYLATTTSTVRQMGLQPKKDQKQERQRGDLGLYRFYFTSIAPWQCATWVIMVALAVTWNQMPAIFVRLWLESDPDNRKMFTGYASIGATASMAYAAMLAFYMLLVAPTSAAKLHWVFLQAAMSATFGFLASTDSGTLLNRFSQDMSLIGQALPMVLLNFAMTLFDNIVNIGIIAAGANYGAVIIPFLLFALYLLQHFYLRTSRQMRHLDLEAKSPLYTQFTEMAVGVQHIRAFSWQSHILAQSFDLLDSSQKPYYYMFCIQRWLTLVLELCVMAVAVVLVTMALNLPRTTSEGAIGLALLNLISFGSGMASLINAWTRLETSIGAVARLRSFLNDTPPEPDPGVEHILPQGWPQFGRIEISQMNANYGHGDRRLVLRNISLAIEAGQKIGIVGRTGSGKSSLLLSLLNLLDHTGSIVIDGINISDITCQQLRSHITVIGQDPVELPGSVRHNLDPWSFAGCATATESVSDDTLHETLSMVGLRDIVTAKGGLGENLSSMGFSQGQLQLFCLARAILHHRTTNGKVVLVDEATSSVDNDTDKHMQSLMTEAFTGCTVITVAHWTETVRNADRVLVLEAGCLAGPEEDMP